MFGGVPQSELLRMNQSDLSGSLRTRRRRQTKRASFLRSQGVAEDELYYRYEWQAESSRKRSASPATGESGKKVRGCKTTGARGSADDDAMDTE